MPSFCRGHAHLSISPVFSLCTAKVSTTLPFLINDFQGCPGKGKRHIQGFYELNLKYHDSPLVKLSDTATSNLRLDYEPKKRRWIWWELAALDWRRQWHPTPVLLSGKSHGWRSLVGCSPWGREESDTTERLPFHFSLSRIGAAACLPPHPTPLGWYRAPVWVSWAIQQIPVGCFTYGNVSFHTSHLSP